MSNLFADFLNNRIEHVPMSGLDNKYVDTDFRRPPQDLSDPESDSEQREYVKRELDHYYNGAKEIQVPDIENIDAASDCGPEERQAAADLPAAFRLYTFDTHLKKDLPIDPYCDEILSKLETNSVVVIHGPTGCGKTTQVPQYILDDCRARGAPCNIVVTQPRRIAAINLAQRVCEERGWAIGSVCGYQVGLDRRVDENVILTYVTTEVLLQRLIMQKNLNKYTHIIIDEIHERNKSLDFLLLIVRKYLFTNSPKVRIVLMSATIDVGQYQYYFRTIPRNNSLLLAAQVHIKNKTRYTVRQYYIEHFKSILPCLSIPDYKIDDPCVMPQQYEMCLELIKIFDNLDNLSKVEFDNPLVGSVLVFLPGLHEIEEMHKLLVPFGTKFEIIPIHSTLAAEHMAKMFSKPVKGIRKIILSTNIAESSVTVPDVTYVIDFCLTKVMTVHPHTKFASLTLDWASHNNCVQRMGRVGRVADGRVYRLVPKQFYEDEMQVATIPEMQRAPLESIVLYMKQMDMTDCPKNILSLAISPPDLKEVQNCIWHLKELGALFKYSRGRLNTQDGDITFLGRVMVSLPIDVHLSKMVVLGHMFGCLEEAIIMAAGATTRNLFVTSFHERLESYKKKLLWSDGSGSDFIALLNLYNVWLKSKREHSIASKNEMITWCKKNFVNYKGLNEWDIIIKEIKSRLANYNIKQTYGVQRLQLPPNEKAIILKIVICGAFYPSYFTRSIDFGKVDSREAVKVLNGRDPNKTVYLTNMKQNQPGQIYVRQIMKLLNIRNAKVGFDAQSSKIFVEFSNNRVPQQVTINGQLYIASCTDQILPQVYEAVRKRQLRQHFHLNILPDHKAWDFVKTAEAQLNTSYEDVDNTYSNDYVPLPSFSLKEMLVYISHVNHIGNFYCQNRNDDNTDILTQKIFRTLNAPEIFLQPVDSKAEKVVIDEKLYAAKFSEDGKIYRCKIVFIHPTKPPIAEVLFVDYGNMQKVPINKLFHLPKKPECGVRPLAINCTLSEVQPVGAVNANEPWKPFLNDTLRRKSDGVLINAKIYSVVNDIVHMELFLPNAPLSFNQWLVQQQYARKCEESYISKLDHDRRINVQQSATQIDEAAFAAHARIPRAYDDFASPSVDDFSDSIELKGPFSPLEMQVCGMLQASASVRVVVDELSVNTVLLDDRPEEAHARMLVAGTTMQSSLANVLRVGQTTLMPNIPGLPMLMALLFCPEMEPKLTEDHSKVASILCGLGLNPATHRANYALHDVALVLDTELTEDIILKVNELRFLMNDAIKLLNNIMDGISYDEEFVPHQTLLKKTILQLLHMKQEPVKRIHVRDETVWKGQNVDYELLQMEKESDKDFIWPLLTFAKLDLDQRKNYCVYENLSTLREMAKNLVPVEEINCLLCDSQMFHTISEIRIHLISQQHTDKLEQNQFSVPE